MTESVTISSKCQIVLPKQARERLGLAPGMKLHVIESGGILHLVPERSIKDYRGMFRGIDPGTVREKADRY